MFHSYFIVYAFVICIIHSLSSFVNHVLLYFLYNISYNSPVITRPVEMSDSPTIKPLLVAGIDYEKMAIQYLGVAFLFLLSSFLFKKEHTQNLIKEWKRMQKPSGSRTRGPHDWRVRPATRRFLRTLLQWGKPFPRGQPI